MSGNKAFYAYLLVLSSFTLICGVSVLIRPNWALSRYNGFLFLDSSYLFGAFLCLISLYGLWTSISAFRKNRAL